MFRSAESKAQQVDKFLVDSKLAGLMCRACTDRQNGSWESTDNVYFVWIASVLWCAPGSDTFANVPSIYQSVESKA